jgi:hypothetical protein
VCFIVIGVYFILNLILAVAFSQFMDVTKRKVAPRVSCGEELVTGT